MVVFFQSLCTYVVQTVAVLFRSRQPPGQGSPLSRRVSVLQNEGQARQAEPSWPLSGVGGHRTPRSRLQAGLSGCPHVSLPCCGTWEWS